MHNLPLQDRVLGPILRRTAEREADRPYLEVDGEVWSFADTYRIVRALSCSFRRLGIGKGDRIAMMLPNGAEFIFTWYACVNIGAVIVPINTTYTGALLDYLLTDSGSRALILSADYLPALADTGAQTRAALEWVGVVGAGVADRPAGPARWLGYEELLAGDGADPEVACTFEDTQAIMYTSGTTGPSKGVVMPNGHFFSSTCTFLRAVNLSRDDVLFTPMPLFHGVASRLGALPCLMMGAKVVIARQFSASRYFQQAAACGATIGQTIFTMQTMLKAQPPGPFDRAHRMTRMFNASYDAGFEERFGVKLVEAYGMTETGLTLYTPFGERREGSCGRIHEDWELNIVDEQGLPVSRGAIGEIALRPKLPSIMMRSYINKPSETLQTFADLWFKTGDYARADEDGYVFFTSRKKERIRRRGENISPYEIESVVISHPAVSDCAAVAVPAAEGEDDVRIVCEVSPASGLRPDELLDWLQGRLPRFMTPRYVDFVAALPRTPNSKVEKYRLMADGIGQTTWDRATGGYVRAPQPVSGTA
ncbi:AMP-binding protein [Aquabacter sp. CN5-332]|uniref:AMP-binding protein n=1 Tax=Aquabacter sp. CN5-332 TaxID=3156608 RepID=UPI0032B3ADF1